MNDKTLIIGAGPAGLACAMELCRSGETATIIEKDAQIGGLAKTLTFTEGEDVFHTDVGPHRFFSKNEYLYAFIEDLLHDEWRKVPRSTRQYIDGKFYDYPVAPIQVLKNIGPLKAAQMAAGYLGALIQFGLLRKKVLISRFVNLTSPTQTQLKQLCLIRMALMCWSTTPASRFREQ